MLDKTRNYFFLSIQHLGSSIQHHFASRNGIIIILSLSVCPSRAVTGRGGEASLGIMELKGMGLLEGKVALVTGAAKGLGRAIALKLSHEGAKVAVNDRDRDGLAKTKQMTEEQNGGEVLTIKGDISKEEDTVRMAAETVAKFGAIDVLVNNAAIFYGLKRMSFEDISVDEWDKIMAVNVKGQWLSAKAVAPQMKKQGKGRIINIASALAFMPHPGLMHYLTSKAAILGFTKSLAGALGEYGICVNAVAPGTVMTEARKVYTTGEKAKELAQKNQLIKRPVLPEDLTGIVAFLASDESALITGQTIVVDGGVVLH
jgi:NAD(P)-dependent dehydrogenase (short-subunit alcohol dehydrogenase family)